MNNLKNNYQDLTKKLLRAIILFLLVIVTPIIIFYAVTADDDITPPGLDIKNSFPYGNIANYSGPQLTWDFTVTDYEGSNLTSGGYFLNGGAFVSLTPVDGAYDEATEEFFFQLPFEDFNDGNRHVLFFNFQDSSGNTRNQIDDPYLYSILYPEDLTPPVVELISSNLSSGQDWTSITDQFIDIEVKISEDKSSIFYADWSLETSSGVVGISYFATSNINSSGIGGACTDPRNTFSEVYCNIRIDRSLFSYPDYFIFNLTTYNFEGLEPSTVDNITRFNYPADSIDPQFSFTQSVNGQLNINEPQFSYTYEVTDNSLNNGQSVSVYYDYGNGEQFLESINSQNGSATSSFLTEDFDDGSVYNIEFIFRDNNGNESRQSYTVFNNPSLTPPNLEFNESYTGLTTNAPDPIIYLFEVTDASGIDQINYKINTADTIDLLPVCIDQLSNSTLYNCTLELDKSAFDIYQDYTITITAINNNSLESSQSFSIFGIVPDDVPPEITTIQGVSGEIYSRYITLIFEDFDEGSSISERILEVKDSIGNLRCNNVNAEELTPSRWRYTIDLFANIDCIEDQVYTISYKVIDSSPLANEATTTLSFIKRLDEEKPQLLITQSPDSYTIQDPVLINFSTLDNRNIVTLTLFLNGTIYSSITPTDGVNDELSEQWSVSLPFSNLNLDTLNTFEIYVDDGITETTSESITFTPSLNVDDTPPVINLISPVSGLTPASFRIFGNVEDAESNVTHLTLQINSSTPFQMPFITTGDLDSPLEEFDYIERTTLQPLLVEGSNIIKVVARDEFGNESEVVRNLDIDAGLPDCSTTWNSKTYSILYGNTDTYTNIQCSDNRGIYNAEYTIYHEQLGFIEDNIMVPPQDSTWGGINETFDFTYLIDYANDFDGAIQIVFTVKDLAGNETVNIDPLVIEYFDDTPPIVVLDPITPDPTTDTTITITGSCRDNTRLDTNTNIATLQYRINSGTYENFLPLDNTLNNSTTETYSHNLPELSSGTYTIDVKCADSIGLESTVSDTFEIIPIDPDEPAQVFEHSESFENRVFSDVAQTDLVWGNGQLRLREDIIVTTWDLINSNGSVPRYADARNAFVIEADKVNNNILWYTRSDSVYSYNTSTNTNQLLNLSDFGILDPFITISDLETSVWNGQSILWISDAYRYYVLNLNTLEGISLNLGGDEARHLTPDTQRGRLGAYIRTADPGAGLTNMAYWDLNSTLTNNTDDIVAYYPSTGPVSATGYLNSVIDISTNSVFASFFDAGIYRIIDNNTPTNFLDDIVIHYNDSNFQNVFGSMVFSPEGDLFFGTSNNGNPGIYYLNDNNTPSIGGDDVITRIAQARDLNFYGVGEMVYVEGINNVGDQLFIQTSQNPIYLNFNNTITDTLDDTYIVLDFNQGYRPSSPSIFMYDYNTAYSNIGQLGFYRNEIERGWLDTGVAVAVPSRPSNRLALDNYILITESKENLAYIEGSERSYNFIESILSSFTNLFSLHKINAQSSGGVNYAISNDDGVTWEPISVGSLKQLDASDYRVKVRIEMAEVSNSSPVLDSYSLTFGGYTTSEVATETTSLEILTNTSTTNVGSNIQLTVNALDVLGFVNASDNSPLTLQLINTQTNQVVAGGLNISSVNLVDGVSFTPNLQILAPGTYRIRASDGILFTFSNEILVQNSITPTTSSNPTPLSSTLFITSNKSSVFSGESITLSWNSTGLSNVSILPGIGQVTASGQREIIINETTSFTISGLNSNGNTIQSSVTIEVEEELVPISYTETLPTIFTLEVSQNQIVKPNQIVSITWSSTGSESVYIDYLSSIVADSGTFEFTAITDTTIVITATHSNGETIIKTIFIDVITEEQTNNSVDVISQIGINGPGVVASVAVASSLTSFAFVNLSLAQLNTLNLSNFTSIFKIFFGIIPQKKRRGFIYSTSDGSPISLATLRFYNIETLASTDVITDIQGSYLEPSLGKGKYRVTVLHEDFKFPTQSSRPSHLGLYEFYKGEEFNADGNSDMNLIIPLDSNINKKVASIKTFGILISGLLVRLRLLSIPLLIVSVIVLALSFNIWNLIVTLFYTIVVVKILLEQLKRNNVSIILEGDSEKIKRRTITLVVKQDSKTCFVGNNADGAIFKLRLSPGMYNLFFSSKYYFSETGFGENIVLNVEEKKTTKKIVRFKTLP